MEIIKPLNEEEYQETVTNWIWHERTNPNNFSYWFPTLKEGLKGNAFILPKSIWFTLPDSLMLSTTCETDVDFEDMMSWIISEQITEKVFENFGKECFMKNGCFSDKFSFDSSCHIKDISARSILNHMCNIAQNAVMMDTGGDSEFVFREYIHSYRKLGVMYNGMPIRPEIRVFYDFDKKKVLYSANYWDWDYCKDHLYEDDYNALKEATSDLVFIYNNTHYRIEELLEYALQDVKLTGKWSIDVMLEGANYYIIDMAIAEQSAYWDPNKIKEND